MAAPQDIERAAQALKAVGENVAGVEIQPNGAVRVLTGPYAVQADAPRKVGVGWDDFSPRSAA